MASRNSAKVKNPELKCGSALVVVTRVSCGVSSERSELLISDYENYGFHTLFPFSSVEPLNAEFRDGAEPNPTRRRVPSRPAGGRGLIANKKPRTNEKPAIAPAPKEGGLLCGRM